MVSTISPLATSATAPANKAKTPITEVPKQGLDYDNFLNLLVTQLKNQDPLSPMDDTEYVAQLATFSNVEQNILTNRKLDELGTMTELGSAGAMIGRTVQPATGASGTVTQVKLTSEGAFAVLNDGRQVPLGAGLTIS